MRYELKSIGFWSFIKVAFFINLILGFIIGLIYAMFFGLMISMSSDMFMSEEFGVDPAGMSIGVLFILLPILFAALTAFFQTFLMGLLVALYNLLVKMVGGLEFNLELVGESKTTAIPQPERSLPISERVESQPVAAAVRPTGPPPPPPPVIPAVPVKQELEKKPATPESTLSVGSPFAEPKSQEPIAPKAPESETRESDDPKL